MHLVKLRDLTIDLKIGDKYKSLLHPLNLDIHHGEAIGLVGESGSGKTLTWLAALGLQPPTMRVGGQAWLDDRNIIGLADAELSAIRGRRIAMIFQDPASALNPVHTIGRQIGEALALHRGLSGTALQAEAARLLDAVGIADVGRRLRQYQHEFSGGMNQRVMIAMALAGSPDLLIADEPTTALDVTIQAQILDLLGMLRRETGMAMVFISHDLGVVAEVADRIAVMFEGRIVEDAPTERIFSSPAHPYTRELLGAYAAEDVDTVVKRRPKPAANNASGCAFMKRCTEAAPICSERSPSLTPIGRQHFSACLKSIAPSLLVAGGSR